ncbi:hypothetical protein NQ318_015478 [Aromia moschata]|uniref:Phage protein n=1 Tax=Aromia moschata TaxID=1265417 RepID=A0AAV8XHG4_9CUCU|nr:hypothetical protein NQ318_015478 [Aromia moschata]
MFLNSKNYSDMPYQIVRNKAGWILNQTGQVLVRDSENNDIWIDSNLIHFDQFNRPLPKTCQKKWENLLRTYKNVKKK